MQPSSCSLKWKRTLQYIETIISPTFYSWQSNKGLHGGRGKANTARRQRQYTNATERVGTPCNRNGALFHSWLKKYGGNCEGWRVICVHAISSRDGGRSYRWGGQHWRDKRWASEILWCWELYNILKGDQVLKEYLSSTVIVLSLIVRRRFHYSYNLVFNVYLKTNLKREYPPMVEQN